jgi:uncharacterized membrane protein YciS (DUF1049 family)
MPVVIFIANLFGINLSALAARLIAYGIVIAIVVSAALAIRQHYINKGYKSAIAAVKKQDDRAVEAATKVEKKATVCTEQNGYWDVITQDCKLEGAE